MARRPGKRIVPYVIYDRATGEILATGACAEKNVQKQNRWTATHDAARTTTLADATRHRVRVVDGKPTIEEKGRRDG